MAVRTLPPPSLQAPKGSLAVAVEYGRALWPQLVVHGWPGLYNLTFTVQGFSLYTVRSRYARPVPCMPDA